MRTVELAILTAVGFLCLEFVAWALRFRGAPARVLTVMRLAGVMDGAWMFGLTLRVLSGCGKAAFYYAMYELEEKGLVERRTAYKNPHRYEYTMTELGVSALSAAIDQVRGA